MMNQEYDVAILGAGPGGYVAAIRAAQLGLRVALVEKESPGGVCLNWGCIPTKALLRSVEMLSVLRSGGEFGFSISGLAVDYGKAVDRSRRVASKVVKGLTAVIRQNGIELIEGIGELREPGLVKIILKGGGCRLLECRNTIVATGGQAHSILDIAPDGQRVMTYRAAIVLRDLPSSAIIVGAGPIGMEFAHIWDTYGTDVTIIEMLSRLLPREDEQVSAEIERAVKLRKMRMLTSTRVEEVHRMSDGVCVCVVGPQGEQILQAERLLIAVGVRPNSAHLGLEQVGMRMEQGRVLVDDHMSTSIPGIYAVGDITGKMALAHVAAAQGIVAAETIAGVETITLDYDAIPRCTYCQPQVGSFGLTETQAIKQGFEVKVGQFPFRANGKALTLGDSCGFVKIVADAATSRILGAHLVGPDVTELLPELVLAYSYGLTPQEVARAVHAHPTLSEALVEAAHAVFGAPIHAAK